MSIKRPTILFFLALAALIAGLAFLGTGCGPNAKDKAVADASATVAAGYRTMGVVDLQRQRAIQVLAPVDHAAAQAQFDKHNALRKVLKLALDETAELIERAHRDGLSAPTIANLVLAAGRLKDAVAAYQEGVR